MLPEGSSLRLRVLRRRTCRLVDAAPDERFREVLRDGLSLIPLFIGTKASRQAQNAWKRRKMR